MGSFTESIVEDAALAWLEDLGYAVLHGPEIAAGEPGAERSARTTLNPALTSRKSGGQACTRSREAPHPIEIGADIALGDVNKMLAPVAEARSRHENTIP